MPILFSFRRCPYAMRARLALLIAGTPVQLREVKLSAKPAELFEISPKGTVPVLLLEDRVVEESLEIIEWAAESGKILFGPLDNALIAENDTSFKKELDRYKYPERHPEHDQEVYRKEGMVFLEKLERLLANDFFLSGSELGAADIAILPFVRQFANVDRAWFESAPLPRLIILLKNFENSKRFKKLMFKFPVWLPNERPVFFPVDEDISSLDEERELFLCHLGSLGLKLSAPIRHSFRNAPPTNLNIFLIRVHRALQTQSDTLIGFDELSNLALSFFET